MNNCENYGFILIDTSEAKARCAPVREGDQILIEGLWMNCLLSGSNFIASAQFRRPIDPGERYEIVPLDDLVTADMDVCGEEGVFGVQYWADGNVTPRGCVEQVPHIAAFRRRKKPSLTLPILQSAVHKLLDTVGAQAGHKTAENFACPEARHLAQLINWKAPKTEEENELEQAISSFRGVSDDKLGFAAHIWNACIKHALKS